MGKGKKGDKGASEAKKSAKKSAEKADKKADKGTAGAVAKLPKKKCCESRSRCGRCPLRMLKEGTLPDGYTVHRRKLVKVSEVPSTGKKSKAA